MGAATDNGALLLDALLTVAARAANWLTIWSVSSCCGAVLMIISGRCGFFSWSLSSWGVIDEVEDFPVSDLLRRIHSFRRRRNITMIEAMYTKEGKSACLVSRHALEYAQKSRWKIYPNYPTKGVVLKSLTGDPMFIKSRGPFQIPDIYVPHQRTSLDTMGHFQRARIRPARVILKPD